MGEDTKRNDFIAALIDLNPSNFTELLEHNVLPENTSIQSEDYYKKKDKIKEIFTNAETGVFDEKAFKQFYNSGLRMYNAYAASNYNDIILSEMSRSPFDLHLRDDIYNTGNIYVPSAFITTINDPSHRSRSVFGMGTIADPIYSAKEIAETNFVKDENGNTLDWTPEDRGIFKGLFGPTLAVATYDQDVDENINGRIIHHKKGELMLNENGDPYAQILGDNSYYGKNVITWQDTLTREGTKLNDFNVFDSDGLKTGAGATVIKTALRMIPYFIPYVNTAWGAIEIARETATALPAMAKAINGIITNDDENDFGIAMTRWENTMQNLKPGVSDYGKQHFFSFENIGNIIADSGGQLMSQTMVARIPSLLVKNPTLRTTELGQHMALGYMALTSSTEAYSQFRQAGASERAAGLGALAVAAGMYSLMNTNYFRGLFFEGTGLDENIEIANHIVKPIMSVLSKESFPEATSVVTSAGKKSIMTNISKWVEEGGAPKYMRTIYNKTVGAINKRAKDFENLSYTDLMRPAAATTAKDVAVTYLHRSLNEGYEETLEEVMQDLVKATEALAEMVGVDIKDEESESLDFGFSWKNVAERYLASFFGGALGGATFNMYTRWNTNVLNRKSFNIGNASTLDQLFYYTQLGYGDYMKRLAQKLPWGSKNLSANFTVNTGETNIEGFPNGVSFLSGTNEDNQNLALYNAFSSLIDSIEYIVKSNNLNVDPTLIQNIMTEMSKEAKEKGYDIDSENEEVKNKELKRYAKETGKDFRIELAKKIGIAEFAIKEMGNLGKDIFHKELQIKTLKEKIKNNFQDHESAEANKAIEDSALLKQWEKELKELRTKYDDLVKGKNGDSYLGYGIFKLQPDNIVSKYFVENALGSKYAESTVEGYTFATTGLNFSNLTEDEQIKLKEAFDEYSKTVGNSRYRAAYAMHLNLSELSAQELIASLEENNGKVKDDAVTTNVYGVKATENRELALASVPRLTALASLKDIVNGLNKRDYAELVLRLIGKSTELSSNDPIIFDELVEGTLSYYENAIKNNVVLHDFGPIRNLLMLLNHNSSLHAEERIQNLYNNKDTLGNFGATIDSLGLNPQELKNYVDTIWNQILISPEKIGKILDDEAQKLVELINYEEFNFEDALDVLKTLLYRDINLGGELIDLEGERNIIDRWYLASKDIPSVNLIPFLNTLSVNMFGTSILLWDAIDDNINKFLSDPEFMVGDEVENQLKAAQQLLGIAEALVLSSGHENINGKINPLRIKNGLEPFAELPISLINLYVDEIRLLEDKINTLLELSKQNSALSAKEQAKIPINVIPKLLTYILKPLPNGDENILGKRIKDEFNLKKSLLDIFNEATDNFDYEQRANEGNINSWSEALVKFSDAFRETIRNSSIGADKKLIGKAIARCFGNELSAQDAGKLSSDTDLTPFTVYMWLQTIANISMTSNKNELGFYDVFKSVVKDLKNSKGDPIIPFFGHEFDVMLLWGQLMAMDAFDAGLDVISGHDINDPYIKERGKGKRIFYVDGIAGAGKSEAVIRIFINMVRSTKEVDIFNNAVTEGRREAVNSILGLSNDKSALYDEVWNRIASKSMKDGIIISEEASDDGHMTKLDSSVTFKEGTNRIFDNSAEFKIMVIDEATLLSEAYMVGMSKFAEHEGNVFILAAGDIRQNAYKTPKNNLDSNIKDMVISGRLPSLTISLREAYKAKKDNNNVIRRIQNKAFDEFTKTPSIHDEELGKLTEESLKDEKQKTLGYLLTEDGFYGDLLIKKDSEWDSWIQKLLELANKYNETHPNDKKKTVAIVVNSENDFSKYIKYKDNENITIITAKDVQGWEYDYLAVDLNFSSRNANIFHKYRDVETIMTRAIEGAVYKYYPAHPLDEPFSCVESPFANRIIKSRPEVLTDYKAVRDQFYESITGNTGPAPTANPTKSTLKIGTSGSEGSSNSNFEKSAANISIKTMGSEGIKVANNKIDLSGKTEEEIIDALYDEKLKKIKSNPNIDTIEGLTSRGRNELKKLKNIIEDKNSQAALDWEKFFIWVNNINDAEILRGTSDSFFKDLNDNDLENAKLALKYLAAACLNGKGPGDSFKTKVMDLLVNLVNGGALLDAFINSFNDENSRAFFCYKLDGKIIVNYAFAYEGKWKTLPIAIKEVDNVGAWLYDTPYKKLPISSMKEGVSLSSGGQYIMPLKNLLDKGFIPEPENLAILATYLSDTKTVAGKPVENSNAINFIAGNNGGSFLFLNTIWDLGKYSNIEDIYTPSMKEGSIISATSRENITHEKVQWRLTLTEALKIAVLEDLIGFKRYSNGENNSEVSTEVANNLRRYFSEEVINNVKNSVYASESAQGTANKVNNQAKQSLKILSGKTSDRIVSALYRYFATKNNEYLNTFLSNFINVIWNTQDSKDNEGYRTSSSGSKYKMGLFISIDSSTNNSPIELFLDPTDTMWNNYKIRRFIGNDFSDNVFIKGVNGSEADVTFKYQMNVENHDIISIISEALKTINNNIQGEGIKLFDINSLDRDIAENWDNLSNGGNDAILDAIKSGKLRFGMRNHYKNDNEGKEKLFTPFDSDLLLGLLKDICFDKRATFNRSNEFNLNTDILNDIEEYLTNDTIFNYNIFANIPIAEKRDSATGIWSYANLSNDFFNNWKQQISSDIIKIIPPVTIVDEDNLQQINNENIPEGLKEAINNHKSREVKGDDPGVSVLNSNFIKDPDNTNIIRNNNKNAAIFNVNSAWLKENVSQETLSEINAKASDTTYNIFAINTKTKEITLKLDGSDFIVKVNSIKDFNLPKNISSISNSGKLNADLNTYNVQLIKSENSERIVLVEDENPDNIINDVDIYQIDDKYYAVFKIQENKRIRGIENFNAKEFKGIKKYNNIIFSTDPNKSIWYVDTEDGSLHIITEKEDFNLAQLENLKFDNGNITVDEATITDPNGAFIELCLKLDSEGTKVYKRTSNGTSIYTYSGETKVSNIMLNVLMEDNKFPWNKDSYIINNISVSNEGISINLNNGDTYELSKKVKINWLLKGFTEVIDDNKSLITSQLEGIPANKIFVYDDTKSFEENLQDLNILCEKNAVNWGIKYVFKYEDGMVNRENNTSLKLKAAFLLKNSQPEIFNEINYEEAITLGENSSKGNSQIQEFFVSLPDENGNSVKAKFSFKIDKNGNVIKNSLSTSDPIFNNAPKKQTSVDELDELDAIKFSNNITTDAEIRVALKTRRELLKSNSEDNRNSLEQNMNVINNIAILYDNGTKTILYKEAVNIVSHNLLAEFSPNIYAPIEISEEVINVVTKVNDTLTELINKYCKI